MAELIDKGALINQLRNENIPFNADINSIIIMQPTVTEAEIRAKAYDRFAEALLTNEVVDKSVVRRVAEQLKERE